MNWTTGDLADLIAAHGLWVLIPLSIIEGPIVSVLGGWAASLGLMSLWLVFVVIIIGDVLGDCILYAAGRGVRLDRLPVIGRHLRIPRATLVPLVRRFRDNGVKVLVIAKLTHAAGFAALIAAGAAKLPLGQFLLGNFIAAVPKAAALIALGWFIGAAHETIAEWFSWGGAVGLAVILAGALVWWLWHRWRQRVELARLEQLAKDEE